MPNKPSENNSAFPETPEFQARLSRVIDAFNTLIREHNPDFVFKGIRRFRDNLEHLVDDSRLPYSCKADIVDHCCEVVMDARNAAHPHLLEDAICSKMKALQEANAMCSDVSAELAFINDASRSLLRRALMPNEFIVDPDDHLEADLKAILGASSFHWRVKNYFIDKFSEGLRELPSVDIIMAELREYWIHSGKSNVDNDLGDDALADINFNDNRTKDTVSHSKEVARIFEDQAPQGRQMLTVLLRFRDTGLLDENFNKLLDQTMPSSVSPELIRTFDDLLNYFSDSSQFSYFDIETIAAELELRAKESFRFNPKLWSWIRQLGSIGEGYMIMQSVAEKKANSLGEEELNPVSFNVRPIGEIEALHLPSETDIENYAIAFFSLRKSDIPQDFAGTFLPANPHVDTVAIREMILSNPNLLRRGVENELARIIGDEKRARKSIDGMVAFAFAEMKKHPNSTLRDRLENNMIVIDAQQFAERENEEVLFYRDKALRNSDFNKTLESYDFPHSKADDELGNLFSSRETGKSFISTYFGHGFIGIEHGWLVEKVKLYSKKAEKDDKAYLKFQKFNSKEILVCLAPEESGESEDSFYQPNHLFVDADGGRTIFSQFSRYFKPDDVIAVTNEEYSSLYESFKGDEQKNLNNRICVLPSYTGELKRDDEKFKEKLKEAIVSSGARFMLISEVSRRGSLFPLHLYAEVRDELRDAGREFYFILDGCQAFGKHVTNLDKLKPDVYFASSAKGTDMGTGAILLLSKDIVEANPDVKMPYGTKSALTIGKFRIALDPEGAGLKNVLTTPEREDAIQNLSMAFVDIADSISNLHIKTPTHDYRDKESKKPIKEKMTGTFEVEIDGVSRARLISYAKKYGVHFIEDYEDPISSNSVRIGFHPMMGADSLRILGYVLKNVTPY